MKRTAFVVLFALIAVCALAQPSDEVVLRFLGIPVDGPKEEMISKLKAKGFKYNFRQESLSGEFNGKNVDVYLHATHNKVDRVFIQFPYTSKENVRSEYNELIAQFEKNKKYTDFALPNAPIPDNEDIYYEMSLNNKRYQAVFYYKDLSQDMLLATTLRAGEASMSREQFAVFKQRMESYHSLSDSAKSVHNEALWEDYDKKGQASDSTNALAVADQAFKTMESLLSVWPGQVWFIISEHYGRYCICMYYDNMLNKPNGEDL